MNALNDGVAALVNEVSQLGDGLFDARQLELHDDLEAVRARQRIRASSGEVVFDLSMVNPDLAPPRAVLDRLLESVTKGSNHRYAVSRGVRRLREGFAVKYRERFGYQLDPESEVCVCLGSKDATFHALRILLHPGDAVIVPSLAYPAHPSAVALAGGRVVSWMASNEPEAAASALEQLARESSARVLLLNFPSNPAGVTVSRQWWEAIGAVCRRCGITVVNDFVYGEMCFSGAPAESALCLLGMGVSCVEVYSLSKAYNVPGWRVGALVGDRRVVSAVSRVKSQADYGLFLPLQYAAAHALTVTQDLVRPTVETYQRRLRVLSDGLRDLGWGVTTPQAGACLWASFPERLPEVQAVSRFKSVNVARHLLESYGVLITPGVVFGRDFDNSARFAAVVSEERLREVLKALRSV
jgi:alanine-synthesizing transaminase